MRPPCSFTPPHYHAYGTEVSINAGPDSSQFVLMLSEDMTKAYFFKFAPFTTVTIPQGWPHTVINTCGRVRTITVVNHYDHGNTLVPWAGKLAIDADAVQLSGATKEEFTRIYKWVQDANGGDKAPAGSTDSKLPQACLDYCAKEGKAAVPAPKPASSGRRLVL